MLSNRKHMDNVVGEKTALSIYILNNKRSFFFFPLQIDIVFFSFHIPISLLEQDISVQRLFSKVSL